MVSPNVNDITSDKNKLDPYVKKQNAKLTQVVQNFFSKAVHIIFQSRCISDGAMEMADRQGGTKANKWFNLHMQSGEISRDELKLWRGCSDLNQLPPMIIETYLDLRQLTNKQIVMLKDEMGHNWTVGKGGGKKQEVVLERWLVEFDVNDFSGSAMDELPLIYKQAIILFRSVYGFSRLMPAFNLRKKLNTINTKNLALGNKVMDGKQPISSKGRIGLSKTVIPQQFLNIESHVNQKSFKPIHTTLGTLKISVAYRKHSDFVIQDSEELLSTHFISIDSDNANEESPISDQRRKSEDKNNEGIMKTYEHNKRLSLSDEMSMSVSPCSIGNHVMRESSPSYKKHMTATPPAASQRPSIQPFKIGSISNSPPSASHVSSSNIVGSLERRISITSNKSTSNASLAALLRNPRSSTSSGNTPSNIPIANNPNSNQCASVPRSIASSHGSNLQHEDTFFSYPESNSNTPRFSSSFGSRASRRFSSTSTKQATPTSNTNDTSLLGSSAGSTSSGIPLSGIYIDDDISDFVRMIDSKSDLRFSSFNPGGESKNLNQGSNSQLDALNRFQLLKSQHQQIGDSVSASLILQHNQINSSRQSSRKSSHSVYSPPPSLPSGSYDNSHLPSINSKLKETNSPSVEENFRSESSPHDHQILRKALPYSGSNNSNTSFLKSSSTNKLNMSHASVGATSQSESQKSNSSKQPEPVSGLATTPSAYKSIQYENVFEEDDGEDYYLSHKLRGKNIEDSKSSKFTSRMENNNNEEEENDDDDLLFTMSDMNLTKN